MQDGATIKQVVAIVEDDAALRASLAELLASHGFKPQKILDFENAAREIIALQPNLVLLDLKLPKTDGAFIVKEIKDDARGAEIPVVILTSKTQETDEIISMSMGADDYVTKPFSPSLLLAHIEAVLRRYNLFSPSKDIVYKNFTFSPARGTISLRHLCHPADTPLKDSEGPKQEKQTVELTRNEQRILAFLLKHKGQQVSREALMCELWDTDAFVDDNTLSVNMGRLRDSLAQIGVHDLIKTRRGYGYMLE